MWSNNYSQVYNNYNSNLTGILQLITCSHVSLDREHMTDLLKLTSDHSHGRTTTIMVPCCRAGSEATDLAAWASNLS